MRTTLKIESIEDKQSAKGRPYKLFKTTEGPMTCFELDVVSKLVTNVGKLIEVEVIENRGFKNIKQFYGDSVKVEKIDVPKPLEVPVLALMQLVIPFIQPATYEAECKKMVALYKELIKL